MIIIKKDKNQIIINDFKIFKIIILIFIEIVGVALIYFETEFIISNIITSIKNDFKTILLPIIPLFILIYIFLFKEKIIIDKNKNSIEFYSKNIKIGNIKNIFYERKTNIKSYFNLYTNKNRYSIFITENTGKITEIMKHLESEKNTLKILSELKKLEINIKKEKDTDEKNTDESKIIKDKREGIDDEKFSEEEIVRKVDEILSKEDNKLNH